jgi:hypothetical protein
VAASETISDDNWCRSRYDGGMKRFMAMMLFAGGASAAPAEDFLLLAPTQISFEELRSAGKLIGCEIDLLKATKDYVYAGGLACVWSS